MTKIILGLYMMLLFLDFGFAAGPQKRYVAPKMETVTVEATRLPPAPPEPNLTQPEINDVSMPTFEIDTPDPVPTAAPAAALRTKRPTKAPVGQQLEEINVNAKRIESPQGGPTTNSYQAPAAETSSVDYSAYDTKYNSCEAAQSVAAECCTNPERCLTKPDGAQTENEGMGGALIQLAAGTAMSVPSSSISAACGKMKTVSQAMSAVNGYLGYQCGHYVSQCKETCGPSATELNAKLEECSDPNSYECKQIRDLLSKFAVATNECMTYDNQSARLTNQAIANQMAAKYADQCKKLAEKKPDTNNPDLFANPDCTTPTAAASPICQAQCQRPGAASDPNCAGFFAANPGTGTESNPNVGKLKNPFDGLVGDDEGAQNPNLADIAALQQKSSGSDSGGGGGGLGGGDSGGGGGGDGAAGAGGEEGGYDTNISRGLASGNGYSSSSGGYRASGGSGFGGSTAITNSGKPFNLKDFLPGKNNLKSKLRGIASLSAPEGISPAHGNIFVNVTNRFYQVCLRDALLDCATLKKMKKMGN